MKQVSPPATHRLPTRTCSPFPILLAHSASDGKLPSLLPAWAPGCAHVGIKTVPREC